MLPDYLVPAKYHITPVEQQPTEAEKEASFTQGKRKLSDFEPDILIGGFPNWQIPKYVAGRARSPYKRPLISRHKN